MWVYVYLYKNRFFLRSLQPQTPRRGAGLPWTQWFPRLELLFYTDEINLEIILKDLCLQQTFVQLKLQPVCQLTLFSSQQVVFCDGCLGSPFLGGWRRRSQPAHSSPFFPLLCLYMYVCVSRKQSDKWHPDLADGALRPVFLTLLPEPVTPATLLRGGRQSRPQPVLILEETQ